MWYVAGHIFWLNFSNVFIVICQTETIVQNDTFAVSQNGVLPKNKNYLTCFPTIYWHFFGSRYRRNFQSQQWWDLFPKKIHHQCCQQGRGLLLHFKCSSQPESQLSFCGERFWLYVKIVCFSNGLYIVIRYLWITFTICIECIVDMKMCFVSVFKPQSCNIGCQKSVQGFSYNVTHISPIEYHRT